MNNFLASCAVAIPLACFATASSGAELLWQLRPDYRGTVYDRETGAPLPGVYVIGEYREGGGELFGHSASWCVKTEGAYTDAKGRVTLPRSKSGLPSSVYAIKQGYTEAEDPPAGIGVSREVDNSIFYLRKQVAGKFNPPFDFTCERPQRPHDNAANLVYLNLVLGEYQRHDPRSPRIATLQIMIDLLKTRMSNFHNTKTR